MTALECSNSINGTILCGTKLDRNISCGFVCDLLSWVMAKGTEDMAWVTVQTNINVIAVAALHDITCIILPDGIIMEGAPLDKAKEEDIIVISSPMTAYDICGTLYASGIK